MTDPIITRLCGSYKVRQRSLDGYISVADICRVHNRNPGDYTADPITHAWIAKLCETVPSANVTVQEINAGAVEYRGPWVPPRAAMHFARWIGCGFDKIMPSWINPYIGDELAATKRAVAMDKHIAAMKRHYADEINEESRIAKILEETLCEYKRYQAEVADMAKKSARMREENIVNALAYAELCKDDPHTYAIFMDLTRRTPSHGYQ